MSDVEDIDDLPEPEHLPDPIWVLSHYRSALMRMPAVRVAYTETPMPELPERCEKDRT